VAAGGHRRAHHGRRRRRRVHRALVMSAPAPAGARFTSYYGRPIIKAPVWGPGIPLYLFTGGLAAGAAMLAAGADLTGRAAVRRAGRLTALGAIGASIALLINDLGRPDRFHHLLRVAKPTSPLSVGTWVISAFGTATGVAAASELASWLPRGGPLGPVRTMLPPAGRVAGLAAAGVAPALATYTAVLLADTAVPSWHEAHPHLPRVFAGSALASAAGAALIAAPLAESEPVRRLAVAGAALELVGTHTLERRMDLLSEPYRTGRAGRLLRAARVIGAAGMMGTVLGRRSRAVSALSGAALLAASVATRFGVFEGGVASTRDPKYTVVPQRQRRDQR
jgi:hypothetical protein